MNLSQLLFTLCIFLFVIFVYWAKSASKQESQQNSVKEEPKQTNQVYVPTSIQQFSSNSIPNSVNSQENQLNSCLRSCQSQQNQQQCIKMCLIASDPKYNFLHNVPPPPPPPQQPVILFQTVQKEPATSSTFTNVVIWIVLFILWRLYQENRENFLALVRLESQVERIEVAAEIRDENYRDNLGRIYGDLRSLESDTRNLAVGQGVLAEATQQLRIGLQSCGDRIYRLSGALKNERERREDFERRQIGYNRATSTYLENYSRRINSIENRPPERAIEHTRTERVVERSICIIS